MLRTLWNDECGFVISAELVLVMTIGVLAMIVGLNAVAKSVVMKLNDISNAIGAIDQSYYYKGLQKRHHAWVAGSGFKDGEDHCDCSPIRQPRPRVKAQGSGPESGGHHHGH